jgi:hypothetical protein
MTMQLRKRSVSKAKPRSADKRALPDVAKDAERLADADKRPAVRHKDAMDWLRAVAVKKRRLPPPWK